jgi:hypothetical protein
VASGRRTGSVPPALRPRVAQPAGYSGTPLFRKLGLKPGHVVALLAAPSHYVDLVSPLPDGVRLVGRMSSRVDIMHLFATRRTSLVRTLQKARSLMRDDAVMWVSWPKISSGVSTDINEDTIRTAALPLGLVDVKVCAVDQVWSALKLVVRRELRGAAKG